MNLSQEQLAEKLNVSQNMIAKIECGLRRPSVDFLIELAEFFEISLHYIVIDTLEEATDKKQQIEEAIEQIDQMMELLQNKRTFANERKIRLKQQEVPLCVKKHTAVFFCLWTAGARWGNCESIAFFISAIKI